MSEDQLMRETTDEKESISSDENKNHPLIIALMAVMFALPVCAGSALLHYLFFLLFFLFFAGFVFLNTRKYAFSLCNELRKHHNILYYLILALVISSMISYLRIVLGDYDGFRKIMATSRYLMYFTAFLYAFSLARFSLLNRVSHSQLFFSYMMGTVALVFLFLAVYHFEGAFGEYGWAIDPPFGRHVRLMSMGGAVSLLVCVILYLLGNNSQSRNILLWFCMLICGAFLIWTGSRASMLVAVLAMVFLISLLLVYRKTDYRKLAMVFLAIALAVLVADKFSVFSWNGLHRAIEVSTVNVQSAQVQAASVYEVTDKLTSGRIVIWQTTFNTFKQSPWFGFGPNASLFVIKLPDVIDQPHNFILQFLIEWGAVGTTLLLLILTILAWHGLKRIPNAIKQGDVDYIISASVVFILTINGLTDGAYYHVQPILCMATAFAVFPFLTMKEKGLLK